jgi:hypothetical protein
MIFVSVSLILYLFAQHSHCGVGIMRVVCAVRKDVDVILSVLLSLAVGSSALPE